MKKLFFIAALATVAIGGAYAYYPAGSNTNSIICDAGPAICSDVYGTPTAYTVPFNSGQQNQTTQVDLSQLPAFEL